MPFEKSIGQLMHPLSQYGVLYADATILTATVKMQRAMENNGPAHLIVVSDAPAGNEMILKLPFLNASLIYTCFYSLIGRPHDEGGRVGDVGASEYRQAQEKTVAEIMSPVSASIEEDEMLMEAIFLMNRHGVRLLPVTRNDEVTGVVHFEDVLQEILERSTRKT